MKRKKILITGAAGFIGFHLVKRLAANGFDLVGLDNINDYYDVNLKYGRLEKLGIPKNQIENNRWIDSKQLNNFKFIKLDLTDRSALTDLFQKEKFDYVCHLAAQAGVRYSLENPYVYIESNISGFLNILEGCRENHVKHLVYASSSSVYGLNEQMPFSTHHNVDHPISLYAATKKSGELMAHVYSQIYGLPVTGLRFFTVYGPWGRPDMALFKFVRCILEGKEIEVYNYGQSGRDFTYIDDIIEGIYRLLELPPKGDPGWNGKDPDPSGSKNPYKIYNIGSNTPVPLLEFIQIIEDILGKKAIMKMLPMQAGDVLRSWADVTDLENDFGYAPKTPLKKGVKEFIDWYLDFYKINHPTNPAGKP